MNIALIILYCLIAVSLLIAANMHGKPKGDYNFWISLLSTVIELALIWWMLGWRLI